MFVVLCIFVGVLFFFVTEAELDLLKEACSHHSDGHLVADVTVMTCWDADRLDLGRVGIRPDPERLCNMAARCQNFIAEAYRRSLAFATD